MSSSSTEGAARSTAAGLPLSVSVTPGWLTAPLLRGEVGVEGVDPMLTEAQGIDGNSRRMLDLAYDVAEMSLGTFVKAREQGVPIVALPIFTERRFTQPGLVATARSGIRTPEDFRGKRVAVNQLWTTSSIWHRGVLQQYHDVPQASVTWYTASAERMAGMTAPPGVIVQRLPEGVSPEDALLRGDVDAVLNSHPVDKLLAGHADLVRPYLDVPAAERAFVEATGVLPILHCVVMREDREREHPWLAGNLCRAFAAARARALAAGAPPPLLAGGSAAADAALFGMDIYPYGLEPNRRSLEAFLRMTYDLGLVARPLGVGDVLAPSASTFAG
jgi:4,5-dihydroxyphthalate decarboxylase